MFLIFTLVLSLLLAYGKKAREGKLLYALGIAAVSYTHLDVYKRQEELECLCRIGDTGCQEG